VNKTAAKILGDQLRRAREGLGVSVAKAARTLGVSRQTIYNYESGKRLQKMRLLVKAATAWNATFEISGCKIVPEEARARSVPQPLPIQRVLPFNRLRKYKKASVEIRPRDHEIVITAILRTGL